MCPNIWDLTKTESFRKEFRINPKYWDTVKIRINRSRYRLSENSIPFVLVIVQYVFLVSFLDQAGTANNESLPRSAQRNTVYPVKEVLHTEEGEINEVGVQQKEPRNTLR